MRAFTSKHPVLVALFVAALAAHLTPLPTPAQEAGNEVYDPSLFQDLSYRMIGPYRGGRATAEAGHPAHPHTFYIGTTGGGVWKTTDAGHSWRNISDCSFGGGIGDVVVAPSDPSILYVGEGSADPRGNISHGNGVWRSADGGKTWGFLGLEEAGQIGWIEVHPRDPDVAYVAALGHVFGRNEERGVFKTTDGGETWEHVLQINDSTGVVHVAMNPARPNELLAAAWRVERKPWTLRSGTTWNEGGGLYRTTDGGESWEHLADGLPRGEDLVGKIGVTYSPADPERAWAIIEANDPHGGVYRSDDSGETWERVNRNRKLRQRAFYYTHVHAHPTDENTVYALNTRLYRSVDGGETFDEQVDVPHGDVHGLWINPERPEIMLVSDDGGGQVTVKEGESWTTYYNQPTAEFYRVEVDDLWPYNVYGPQQDNSTLRVPSMRGQSQSREQEWRAVGGGESGHITIQSYDPMIVWAGSYGGLITRKNMETGQSQNVVAYPQPAVGDAPRNLEYRFQWNAPIEVDRFDSTKVYHAAHKILMTTDGGRSWSEVSEDLTYDDTTKQGPLDGPIMRERTGVEIYNTVFAVEPSPHEEGVIWAGTDDGRVWLTRSGAATGNWSEVTPEGLPQWSTVNTIEISPHDPAKAYVTAYRYRQDDFTPYVYRTADYGSSWTRIADGTRGIDPVHPTRVVREDPEREGLLYAGTEYGMYVSFDDGGHWQELQLDLPDTPITDLKVKRGDLVVATQGRSFWILDDLGPLRQMSAEVASASAHLFRPSVAYRRDHFGRGGDGLDGAPEGVVLDYYLADEAPALRMEIVDASGEVVRTLLPVEEGGEEGADEAGADPDPRAIPDTLATGAGHHRVTWDLGYPGVTEKPDDVELWGSTGGFDAAPGRYRARLIDGGDTLSHRFEVQVYPGLQDVTAADLRAQFDLARAGRDTLNSLYAHVKNVRDAREQLRSTRVRLLRRSGGDGDLADRAGELVERLDSLEAELIQPRNESSQDPINFPPKLDAQIAAVYGTVAGATARPTEGSRQRWEDLLPRWEGLRSRVDDLLETDLAAFNRSLERDGVSPIFVPRPGDRDPRGGR